MVTRKFRRSNKKRKTRTRRMRGGDFNELDFVLYKTKDGKLIKTQIRRKIGDRYTIVIPIINSKGFEETQTLHVSEDELKKIESKGGKKKI